MPFLFRTFAIAVLLYAIAQSAWAASASEQDVEDSHDHPLVSRFSGSTIIGYQSVDYDQLQLPLGKYEGDKISKIEKVEGKITRIAYIAPDGKNALEVYRNYMQALGGAGFQVRFECHGDRNEPGCGDGFDFASAMADNAIEVMKGENALMIFRLRPIGGNIYVATTRLHRAEELVDASLLVAQEPGKRVGILLQIVERQPMATGQVTVDAKAIGDGLAQAGHIALYGITFATDSAQIEPGSQSTLAEMAKLLAAQPALKVYIVGHTDASGSLTHNLDLSQRRAEAVVAALVKNHGIAPARLAAKGLASYAPVASNSDDVGRARNRRVELVLQ